MIQNGPPFALTDPYYIWMACLGAAIAWFFKLKASGPIASWWLPTPLCWASGPPLALPKP